ncbi:hypothetical protein DXG03_000921 [Asterophora parasitica]|uniref:Uncharacterized protein n=1 Tax=Asterophora parasitica TaxID=117018 RepID=A0A9P7G4L4_9AGAR|nr:hypothetical protein DXG03_000921 [Asterophora parasitica]
MATQTPNASASFTFNGTSVQIFGAKRGNHGPYSVLVDNTTYPTADGAAPDPGEFQQSLFAIDGLKMGRHEVTIVNQGNTFLDVDFVRQGISLYGPVSPDGATYSVQLDGASARSFTANKALYKSQVLPLGQHRVNVTIRPASSGQVFAIDYANVYSTTPPSTTNDNGLSVAFIVGITLCIVGVFGVLGGLFFFLRRRQRQELKEEHEYQSSSNITVITSSSYTAEKLPVPHTQPEPKLQPQRHIPTPEPRAAQEQPQTAGTISTFGHDGLLSVLSSTSMSGERIDSTPELIPSIPVPEPTPPFRDRDPPTSPPLPALPAPPLPSLPNPPPPSARSASSPAPAWRKPSVSRAQYQVRFTEPEGDEVQDSRRERETLSEKLEPPQYPVLYRMPPASPSSAIGAPPRATALFPPSSLLLSKSIIPRKGLPRTPAPRPPGAGVDSGKWTAAPPASLIPGHTRPASPAESDLLSALGSPFGDVRGVRDLRLGSEEDPEEVLPPYRRAAIA